MLSWIDDLDCLGLFYGGTERAVLWIAGISCTTVLSVGEAAVNARADALSVALGKGERIHRFTARTLGASNETAKSRHEDDVPFSWSSMKTAPSSGL